MGCNTSIFLPAASLVSPGNGWNAYQGYGKEMHIPWGTLLSFIDFLGASFHYADVDQESIQRNQAGHFPSSDQHEAKGSVLPLEQHREATSIWQQLSKILFTFQKHSHLTASTRSVAEHQSGLIRFQSRVCWPHGRHRDPSELELLLRCASLALRMVLSPSPRL